MKKLITLSGAILLGLGAFGFRAVAQGYDRRIDVPGLIPNPARDPNFAPREDPAAEDLARLNHDLERTQIDFRRTKTSRQMRARFASLRREIDELNRQFRHGHGDRRGLRRQIRQVDSELSDLRRDVGLLP